MCKYEEKKLRKILTLQWEQTLKKAMMLLEAVLTLLDWNAMFGKPGTLI